MTEPLTPQENRARGYHEAGHALFAFRVGLIPKHIRCGREAETRYDEETCRTTSVRDRAMIKLAGGTAEEVVLGERSPNCCTHDLEQFEKLLAELAPEGPERDDVRSRLEAEVREILLAPAFCEAVEVLAEWLLRWGGDIGGRAALELVWKKCPAIRPSLHVP